MRPRFHKIKRKEGALDVLLEDEQALRGDIRGMWAKFLGSIVVVMGLSWLVASGVNDGEFAASLIMMLFFGVLLGGMFVFAARQAYLRRENKLLFVRRLLAALLPETLPGSKTKVHFFVDDSVSDRALRRTRDSLAGNVKSYYLDRWLRVRLTLAEGSRVRIKMSRKLKHKKGQFLYDKRRVDLRMRPNPERYSTLTPDERESMRQAIKRAIRGALHDPPEQLHVRLREDSDTLELKIEQWDAELLAPEIIAVLGAYLQEMDNHKLGAPQGSAW